MTEKEVSALVQGYLNRHRLGDITFSVLPDEVHRERYAWHVPVVPSREPDTMFAYYELLAEVETEIDEKEDLNVLFTPVPVGEAAMAV